MNGIRYWAVLCAIIVLVFCLLMAASVAFANPPGNPWGFLGVGLVDLLVLIVFVKKA